MADLWVAYMQDTPLPDEEQPAQESRRTSSSEHIDASSLSLVGRDQIKRIRQLGKDSCDSTAGTTIIFPLLFEQ